MCVPLAAAVIGSAILGAGMSAYQGAKARKGQRKAQAANEASAAKESQRAEEAYNKANQKMPDLATMFAANKSSTSGGMGGTFLTGANGVPQVPLGGASLLGGM